MKIIAALILCLSLIAALAAGCASSSQQEAGQVLNLVRTNIQNEMNGLDRDLAAAAAKISGLEMAGSQARAILASLLPGRPYVVDACTIDRSARIAALEPSAFREFEGSDISQQEQVIRLFRTQKPVLSQNFRAVEGFDAADLEQPVFSADKKISGSVSVLFKPDLMAGKIIASVNTNPGFSLMLMQPDGRIIYDADAAEIGKNTFIDPLYQTYPQLLELAVKVSRATTGSGRYQFLDTGLKQNVNKEAIWDTFSLHGADWRIVLIHTIP